MPTLLALLFMCIALLLTTDPRSAWAESRFTLPLRGVSDHGTRQSMDARVVSYLVGVTDSPSPWEPDRPLDSSPYDWRVYDPVSRRDGLFLRLPGSPTRIRWNQSFRFVEYKIGDRVFRSPWGPDAKPTVAVLLPVDSTICDFWWSDLDTSWNCVLDRPMGPLLRNGSRFEMSMAEKWTSRDHGAHWAMLASDSCWEVSCGCTSRLGAPGDVNARVSLLALQDSMRVQHHPYHGLRADQENGNADSVVTVEVAGIRGARLEFSQGFGDSDHALLPLVLVNSRIGVRATIADEETVDDFGQIGFQQEGRYLLVAGEYSGGNARVVDLRTGKIIFRAPSQGRWSVWTPWPR